MPGNPLVRFDEGRVGRTARCRPLSYSTASAVFCFEVELKALPILREPLPKHPKQRIATGPSHSLLNALPSLLMESIGFQRNNRMRSLISIGRVDPRDKKVDSSILTRRAHIDQ